MRLINAVRIKTAERRESSFPAAAGRIVMAAREIAGIGIYRNL